VACAREHFEGDVGGLELVQPEAGRDRHPGVVIAVNDKCGDLGSWTCSGDTATNCTSSYAGIAGPGPTAKASERILSARYQLLPKKDAATRLIPPGIMDHASCRKFRSSFSTEVTERG